MEKSKLTKRNRNRRRNKRSNTSVFSYQATYNTPYRSYENLPVEDQQFINDYIKNKGSNQNNIDLASKKNKDELWYNIWHRMYAPKVDSPKYTAPTTAAVSEPTSPNYEEYFANFDDNRQAVDYQMDYYNKHGFFDYSPMFVGWDGVGEYMDTTKLSPEALYDILKRYYNR